MDKKYGHTIDGIETGDYIQLHGEEIGEWFKITNRSEEHTSELQSHLNLVCRLLLEKKHKYTEQV